MQPARIELSAGGVIYRRGGSQRIEILIIKDSYGNWGFPKGHIEAGESSREAALRECREETGLDGLRIIDELGTTDWYFGFDAALIHKFCDHFLLAADPKEVAVPQRGEGIQACVWVVPDDLSRVTYPNARHVAELGLNRLSAGGPRADSSHSAAPAARGK